MSLQTQFSGFGFIDAGVYLSGPRYSQQHYGSMSMIEQRLKTGTRISAEVSFVPWGIIGSGNALLNSLNSQPQSPLPPIRPTPALPHGQHTFVPWVTALATLETHFLANPAFVQGSPWTLFGVTTLSTGMHVLHRDITDGSTGCHKYFMSFEDMSSHSVWVQMKCVLSELNFNAI